MRVAQLDIQYVSHFSQLPTITKKALQNLNNLSEGIDLSALDRWSKWPEGLSLRTFVARRGKTIVGWAVVANMKTQYGLDGHEVHVYIKPKFRRRGYGTALVKAARAKTRKKLSGCPWNEPSQQFYESLSITEDS